MANQFDHPHDVPKHPTDFNELILEALHTQTQIFRALEADLQAIDKLLVKIALNTTPIAVKAFVVSQT